MKYRAALTIGIVLLFAVVASAADVTGKWTAQVQGRNGPQERVFDLKSAGATLTGTVSGGQGPAAQIADGKVEGDNISFTVVQNMRGNEVKMKYTGTVSGGEIKFKVEGGRGPQEFTAKKSTT